MSQTTVIFFLSISVGILVLIVVYQNFKFSKGIQNKLRDMSRTLNHILENQTDEKVLVFTDNQALIDLAGQINHLLEQRQKTRADYRHALLSSKKMLSNISHDIKTPLTVILGYLEILRIKDSEDETLKKVENKAAQVMELINQFFTLAKLESGDLKIESSRVNISEICRENILDFYDILVKNDFQVEVNIPDEDIYVIGDRDALNRILSNLVSNAVRYGSDGRYISLSLRAEDAIVYIDVEDHGKGIEKEFAANVFDRLYTMEDSRNRQIQGNGLGLTIARNLARQLGGEVTLLSTPSVKTVFTVQLKRMIY